MRRTSLFLAAAISAASLPFVVNAGAPACDNPDANEVVTDKGWEGALGVGPVPLGAPVFYVHTLVLDTTATAKDVTVTITWDDGLDYDLDGYWTDGGEFSSETQYSEGDQLGGDPAQEVVVIEDVDDCGLLKVGVLNFLGNPTASVNAVIEVG